MGNRTAVAKIGGGHQEGRHFAVGTGGRKARLDVGDCWDHFIVTYLYPGGVKVDFSSAQFTKGYHDLCMRFYGSKGTVDSHYSGVVRILEIGRAACRESV